MTEGELRPFVDNFEPPDPALTHKIVTHLKAQGIFDQFRRDCMADVDTKPAYQNLRQRVEASVRTFLAKNPWKPEMNKNQMRELLRKHLQSGTFLENGMDRIVDQVINPRIYSVFLPKVEDVVRNCLKMDENNKPIFVPPPKPDILPEPPRPSITSRGRVPAPLIGPKMCLNSNSELVKSSSQQDEDDSTTDEKVGETTSSEQDDSSMKNYVVGPKNSKKGPQEDDEDEDEDEEDDDDDEEDEDEDDDEEESPPFELHTENDPHILGVRTDSDSNSDDGLVVTIVDDNLEETLEQNNVEEESEYQSKKETGKNKDSSEESEESSSDEYVPKTPTINNEGSDETGNEFKSVPEYKPYPTKFDEGSFENIEEEIVSTEWIDESSVQLKEEQSSNEDNSNGESCKKLNVESLDDESSSSVDKGSTSDEGKPLFDPDSPKLSKEDVENDTMSEHIINENSNSSCPEKSPEFSNSKYKLSDCDSPSKSKHSSSSKDSDKSSRHHHSNRGRKDENNHEPQVSSHKEKEHKDRSHRTKTHDKHESSKHRHGKKNESSLSKHSGSRHRERSKERNIDKKLELDHKDQNTSDKRKKESHHELREKNSDNGNKLETHVDEKKETESSHKNENDKKDTPKKSKHSHGSSKHYHRSSSDKYKSDSDSKHRDSSSNKHSSHSKKKDKDDKHKSKQKYREHCKSSDRDGEGRRSTDRDSSGPSSSSRSTSSNHSRQSSGKCRTETQANTNDKTSSNSDNGVSEQSETMQVDTVSLNIDTEQVIRSPEQKNAEESDVRESKLSTNEPNYSGEGLNNCNFDNFDSENNNKKCNTDSFNTVDNGRTNDKEILVDENSSLEGTSRTEDHKVCAGNVDDSTYMDVDVENECESYSTPNLVRDSSSEKENIEQAINCDETDNSKVIKFKKPKIAANIFEVKKIMQARRNMKRLEKTKLAKSSSEDDEMESNCNDELTNEEDECFKGFDDTVSNKSEVYDHLIAMLSYEVENLQNAHVPNIITSWMEFDPKHDDYITNCLGGKVHRKVKVVVPLVSDEFYDYDVENKYYTLRDKLETDYLINNTVKTISNDNSPNTSLNNDSTLNRSSCASLSESLPFEVRNPSPQRNATEGVCQSSNTQNVKDDTQTDVSSITSAVSSSNVVFSLSYNTYEDYIRNKDPDNIPESKAPMSSTQSRTVVKITNNKSKEQVVMKNEETDSKRTSIIPRITRMDSKVNGQIPKASNVQKQMPLISRIRKVKDKSKAANSQTVNGTVSPDSTTNSEEESPIEISTEMISEVIGIQSLTLKQGKTCEQRCLQEREISPEKKNTRSSKQPGIGLRQRYDNSDLYKPRLQLTSRRLKAQPVGETVSPMNVFNGRKRPHSVDEKATPAKRRR